MVLKAIGKSFFDLIYPPLCIHCKASLEPQCPIFCKTCITFLSLIEPIGRCPFCFSIKFNKNFEKCCQECIENPLGLDRMAAVFDYEGPPATLIKQLKYAGQTHLAKGAGAYLAAQFFTLEWPLPDVVIPVPSTLLRRFERGANQSLLLAKSFAEIIGCPVSEILLRKSGDFSQAGLDFEQRRALQSEAFSVKRNTNLQGNSILLIDDVMTTGSTLRCCAEVLQPMRPKAIYALTVCRTI